LYRSLNKANPQSYLPNIARTLNNFGVLQKDKNDFNKAEKSYLEALEIYRKLAESESKNYLPDVAGTLVNLGSLRIAINKFEEAEKSYLEAFQT